MINKRSRAVAFGATVIAATVLALGPAMAASADVLKNGTKACGSPTVFSWVHYSVKGNYVVEPPGGSATGYSGSSSSYITGGKQGANGGGHWFVQATIDVNSPSTYAYCTTGG